MKELYLFLLSLYAFTSTGKLSIILRQLRISCYKVMLIDVTVGLVLLIGVTASY